MGHLSDADSLQVREVLLQGLSEPDDEIRGEVSVGLAKRQNTHAIPMVLADLSQSSVHDLTIEAAATFPSLAIPQTP